jgi:hypothetical protein
MSDWHSLLNVLKLFGVTLSGVASVIAAITETKTLDKSRLTPAGRVLLSLGILGFAIAFCSQIIEWENSVNESKAAERRNREALTEIRRAVTRFSSVSMDLRLEQFGFPDAHPINLDDNVSQSKARWKDYTQLLKRHLSEYNLCGFPIESVPMRGDRPVCIARHDRVYDSTYPIYFDPQILQGSKLKFLDLGDKSRDVPDVDRTWRIMVYKDHLKDPEMSSVLDGHPDLDLAFNKGRIRVRANLAEDSKTIIGFDMFDSGLYSPQENWSSSSRILSLEDFRGAQVFLFDGGPFVDIDAGLQEAHKIGVTLIIDHYRVELAHCRLIESILFIAECAFPTVSRTP